MFDKEEVARLIGSPSMVVRGSVTGDVWVLVAVSLVEQRQDIFWLDVQTDIIDHLGLSKGTATTICEKYKQLYQEKNDQQVLFDFLMELRQVAAG